MPDDVNSDAEPTAEMAEQMERYGIVRYPVYHYRVGEYSYRRFEDAVAQAMRVGGEI